MIKTVLINEDTCYSVAEQKAREYFHSLYQQVTQKNYVPTITRDIQSWKHNHIRHYSLFSFFSRDKRNADPRDYHNYIKYLDYTGKLDNYLDRSISYIFMRDLGKALDSKETQARIKSVVNSLKNNLTNPKEIRENKNEILSMAWLYRWGQQESIEPAIIWMIDKLKTVSSHLPEGMDANHAQRKLIKIIAGVVMHEMEEMDDKTPLEERARRLDRAIRLGYSYGLTYPYIDDLLDSKVLSEKEKNQYSNLIRTTLTTGTVPKLGGEWSDKTIALITFIHAELKEGFEYIKAQQHPETLKSFFEQSYVFFHSQEVDRQKDLSYENYTNEELYIPVILKSSSSRLIARSVINAAEDEGFDNRTFYYGIYNQLADDFADMFDDLKAGAVTPYTYYLTYHDKREDLINPFELYWTVISNLIHSVYHSDKKACEVILDRAINGLKRFKERIGADKYNEVMQLFSSGNPKFNCLIQKMAAKADDVDFFDKLLRDHMITNLKIERNEQEEFSDLIENVRNQINHLLPIPKDETLNGPIVEAANYSLEGDGKRLRPIITWIMGIREYGLEQPAIVPLIRSLEYMHTASLIFDDLPSQDNAVIRRGRPTLHMVYDSAIAELTGLYLTQKAIEEQASLDRFNPKTVLSLIQYSSRLTEEMCKGQAMDLNSKGKLLTVEDLTAMCFYKTGLGFEASLIMPAILAEAKVTELSALKKFAYHAGIAFQIKDDLLDVEGSLDMLGKLTGKDEENNNSTFVSILGSDGAKKAMWDHYCCAIETLQEIPRNTTFLKHLLNFMVHREY
ncbi:polyprenyl synthetase family protein [Neobacillus niacini]|uniref:polyprenyl synthetase family protein n=1 Tax=Neobacillus niacini TaxID=86668 RepID=UPI003983D2C3